MTWLFLAVIWYMVIGEYLLQWRHGERYVTWKVRHGIRRGLLIAALWPAVIRRG